MEVRRFLYIRVESLAVSDNERQTCKYQISLNLKQFVTLLVYICLNISYQWIYNNHNFKAEQVHENNETSGKFFIPVWPTMSTLELAMYIATLITIYVHSSQPPCDISTSILCFSLSAAGVLSLSVDILKLHHMFRC